MADGNMTLGVVPLASWASGAARIAACAATLIRSGTGARRHGRQQQRQGQAAPPTRSSTNLHLFPESKIETMKLTLVLVGMMWGEGGGRLVCNDQCTPMVAVTGTASAPEVWSTTECIH